MRPLRWAPPVLLVSLLATACGEPTAQVLETGSGRVTFELPIEFTDLGAGTELGSAWGLPSSAADQLNNDPVVYLQSADGGQGTSYQTLRSIVTGGQYDPLDPAMAEMATTATTTTAPTVLDYEEISDPEVWGIRMRLAVGRGASDFQALVHRQSGEVVVSEVICTQACFLEQLELIDQIQDSWSLES